MEITISIKEYEELLDDRKRLCALENAGINNWEGYEDAMQACDDEDNEGEARKQ